MSRFQSSKLIDGFSTCYRDIKSHNKKNKRIHGSALKFRVHFEGELDYRNWVADFGLFKRSNSNIRGFKPKDYFSYLLDHTTLVSKDDPHLELFKELESLGAIQLRILDDATLYGLAEYLYTIINEFIQEETDRRVKLVKLELYEQNKLAVIYE
jgi:6-pyruvoyltetrahydropterin/6-carboxytetrahydropterin synthase